MFSPGTITGPVMAMNRFSFRIVYTLVLITQHPATCQGKSSGELTVNRLIG
jgi:hypothetical protein